MILDMQRWGCKALCGWYLIQTERWEGKGGSFFVKKILQSVRYTVQYEGEGILILKIPFTVKLRRYTSHTYVDRFRAVRQI